MDGYRIISKATQFKSIKRDYRTLTISFGTHLSAEPTHWTLPMKAIFFATSFRNSFETSRHFFGAPHITEILVNHHTKVSYKVKMTQRSKEKHPDCEEKSYMEFLEELFVPMVIENCPNPCTLYPLPKNSLELCDDDDFQCSWDQQNLAVAEFKKSNYSFKPCSIEEYEGKLLEDEIIDGMQDIYFWERGTRDSPRHSNDIYLPFHINPFYDTNDAKIPTIKFSYTFEQPEIATLQVENSIVTLVDLVGIVGGTLGMFIGFTFYDNIMISVEYVIDFVQWVKRMRLKRSTRKVDKAQVAEDPSTKKKEAISKLMNPKEVVESKKKNANTTLSKEQTKKVKKNETKKNQVTKLDKSKPMTTQVVDETKPKDITSSKNHSKDAKVKKSRQTLEVILVCVFCILVLSIFIGYHSWILYWIISSATNNTSASISTKTPITTSAFSTACDLRDQIGDGFCNDETNNPNCEYDGGDCCGDDVDETYCTYCYCFSGTTYPKPDYTPTQPPKLACHPIYKGDGFCDDQDNNEKCEYDGGDCCGDDVKTTYCTQCLCWDPAYSGCFNAYWQGDGSCDDENNNADCEYDGGDCCGENVNATFCSHCQCLDPAAFDGCLYPGYKSDDACDDESNNADCEYDGGDCCGDNVNTTFCSQCQCLDPAFSTTTPQSSTKTSNTQSTTISPSGCDYPDIQDGTCDDENNNANCDYDGGDCCGDNVDTSRCTQCQCLDPAYSTTSISTTTSTTTP